MTAWDVVLHACKCVVHNMEEKEVWPFYRIFAMLRQKGCPFLV